MTWLAWNMAPFYFGVVMAISILFLAYRTHIGRHPLSERVDFSNPIQWLLTAISILVIYGRGFGIAAVGGVIFLTRWFSGDVFGYLVAGIIGAAYVTYEIVHHIDDKRCRRRLRQL